MSPYLRSAIEWFRNQPERNQTLEYLTNVTCHYATVYGIKDTAPYVQEAVEWFVARYAGTAAFGIPAFARIVIALMQKLKNQWEQYKVNLASGD